MTNLETFLADEDSDLHEKYQDLATKFVPIHESVVAGAAARDGGLLTDHGPNHIARVGVMASSLVDQMAAELSAYEAFLLLVAIQIHDVGNILGREKHEQRIDEIWRQVFGDLGYDSLDKSLAIRIAATHGGKYEGGKDTIKAVDRSSDWKGNNVRPQMLAALLKLADELSEEIDRADRTALKFDSVPRESQIYHVFALGLHTVRADVEAGTVSLRFALSEEYFVKKLGKGDDEEFLLNEIYARTLKTWSESIYCSRFLPEVYLTTVDVQIEIFSASMVELRQTIRYRLEDAGYPEVGKRTIFDICPTLKDFNGVGELTPDALISTLSGGLINQEQKVEVVEHQIKQPFLSSIARKLGILR
ncbi:MAG: hypothetical protein P1U83_18425 [Roseovarius sp.]|nr:hypothetical protein [Roseovarius sp.]